MIVLPSVVIASCKKTVPRATRDLRGVVLLEVDAWRSHAWPFWRYHHENTGATYYESDGFVHLVLIRQRAPGGRLGQSNFKLFLLLIKTLWFFFYNRYMDLLISKLLSKSILDFGKWSNWKYANTYLRIFSLTTSQSPKSFEMRRSIFIL